MEIEKQIDEILTRGVGEFIDPENVFRKKLLAKAKGEYSKDIIIKYGVDPTRPDIHLGHAVCFQKLRQLQDLGCKIIFLIGDYTARIGDPTGKDKTRPELEHQKIEENLKTYIEQIDKIIIVEKDEDGRIKVNSEKFSWIRNSDWFTSPLDMQLPDGEMNISNGKTSLTFPSNHIISKAFAFENSRMYKMIRPEEGAWDVSLLSILWSLKHITFAKLIKRDMFQDRIKNGEDLYMHELLYPIFQGIDSASINRIYGSCDIEIGGTDQTFNMLLGRDIMGHNHISPEQSVLSIKLLEGTDGSEKMSKSLDNYIGITEEPNQMFGKVMSIPDTSIINYYELCTEIPMERIKEIEAGMKNNSLNPRDAKLELAYEIVKIYHGEVEAQKAKEYFVNTFSKKEMPSDIKEVKAQENTKILDYIVAVGFAESKSAARRKLDQGGVSIDGEKISEDLELGKNHDGKVLKVGKKDFVKIVF